MHDEGDAVVANAAHSLQRAVQGGDKTALLLALLLPLLDDVR